MRNMKKFLALVLAMMMMLSVAVFNTSAAEEADYTDAALFLNSLAVMQGSTDGDLMLDAGVERYQAALFFARCLTGKTETEIWNGTPASAYFTDVTMYGTAIDYAYGMGVVKGRGGSIFGANDKIIYQDMIVMAVRALGYETENMSYPWGHIIAAEKLGLLNGIDKVDYKAVMTRGEVGQLLENTLYTATAVIDPLTKEPIYPANRDATQVTTSLNTTIDLVNLLTKAGFVGDTSVTIEYVAFNFYTAEELAEDEELFNSVTIKGEGFEFDVKAEDLGVTEETLEKYYIGFTAEVYFNGAEFTEENYTEGETTIVYVKKASYTTVENLGDGNVKYTTSNDKHYITLGTEKIEFTDGKTLVTVRVWDAANGEWDTLSPDEAIAYVETLAYGKNGYEDATANVYGKVDYRTWTADEQAYAEVLVTEYAFALYGEEELKYTPTATNETFVTLATYEEGTDEDGNTIYFADEKLVTGWDINTNTSVNKKNGEKALNVTVEGSANAGEFVLYEYNKVDNVLTIAATVGTIETGRLSGTNSKGEYKINGTYYAPAVENEVFAGTNIEDLDLIDVEDRIVAEGAANVQYLLYNGKILFIADYSEEGDAAAEVAFAIINADPEKVAEVLDVDVDDLTVIGDLVIEDGNVVVAMLSLTTGEWETAKVAAVATNYEDNEYTDLVKFDKYELRDELGTDVSDIEGVKTDVLDDTFVAVVANEDGVYTLADEDLGEGVVKNTDGFALKFSAAGLSSKISANEDDAASIQTTENTLIIAINGDDIVTKKGVMNSKANLEDVQTVYAASADLIVVVVGDDLAEWKQATLADDNNNYYVVTNDYASDVDYNAEDKTYTVTVEGLYDLRTFAMAEAITFTGVETATDVLDYFADNVGGVVIHNTAYETFNATYSLSAGDDIVTALEAIYSTETMALTGRDIADFEDANNITVSGSEAGVPVSGITVNVALLDNTTIAWDEIEVDGMFVSSIDDASDETYEDVSIIEGEDDKTYYEFEFDVAAENDEINAPVDGFFNQFIIDMAEETITVNCADDTTVEFTYELHIVTNYSEDDVVTAYVVIELIDAE